MGENRSAKRQKARAMLPEPSMQTSNKTSYETASRMENVSRTMWTQIICKKTISPNHCRKWKIWKTEENAGYFLKLRSLGAVFGETLVQFFMEIWVLWSQCQFQCYPNSQKCKSGE